MKAKLEAKWIYLDAYMALSFWWNYWTPGRRRGRNCVCPSFDLASNQTWFYFFLICVYFFQTSHLFLGYLSCFLWKFQVAHVLEMLHPCLCQTQQQQREKEGNMFKNFVNHRRWMGSLVHNLCSLLLSHITYCDVRSGKTPWVSLKLQSCTFCGDVLLTLPPLSLMQLFS